MATAWNEPPRRPGDDPPLAPDAEPGDPVGWVVPLHAGETGWDDRGRGTSAAAGCSSSPATRPSGCGCRSTR